MPDMPILILFAKFPLPGLAKTRLIPALGERGAAAVHRRLAERTVATLSRSALPVEIRYTGATEAEFRKWLGADVALAPQAEGDLSDRLIDAARDTPHIFFGADTPDLEPRHIFAAAKALDDHDIVIGPAEDGGYYLIGMRQARPELLTDMPWSTEQVCPETLRRAEALGLSVALIETLSDCDRPEDLPQWPWLTEELA